jgi:hypothetical protein
MEVVGHVLSMCVNITMKQKIRVFYDAVLFVG